MERLLEPNEGQCGANVLQRTIRFKVLPQGLPHFLMEETSVRKLFEFPFSSDLLLRQTCITWATEKSKDDERILTYQILAYVIRMKKYSSTEIDGKLTAGRSLLGKTVW